jgi:hypothetical protein
MRLEGNDTYHNCYGLLIHGQYFDWDRDLQLFHDSCLLPRLVSFGLLTLKRWLELDFPENAIVLIVSDASPLVSNFPEAITRIYDPISSHIPIRMKEKAWRGGIYGFKPVA